jgi:hypothetical protein
MNATKKENKHTANNSNSGFASVSRNETITEGITVSIIPNQQHTFLMTTREVAKGYGNSEYSIRSTASRNSSELIEGKHYVKGVAFCNTLSNTQPNQVFWTKRGIVRLGFFIKNERAKLVRDWAEDLILEKIEKGQTQTTLLDLPTKQITNKRKHNRLTAERMIDILHDVCQIENAELRRTISNKLRGGSHV